MPDVNDPAHDNTDADNDTQTDTSTDTGDLENEGKPGEEEGNQSTDDNNADTGKPDDKGDEPGSDDKPDGDDDDSDDSDDDEGAPEEYSDFDLPEGVQMDEAMLGNFTELAKAKNLSQKDAQEFVDLYTKSVGESAAKFVAQAQEQWSQQIADWGDEVNNDKEIGGDKLDANMSFASKALDKFGSPELNAVLLPPSEENPKGLGLGNHPALVKTFIRVGKALSEDTFEGGQGDTKKGDGSLADALYGPQET